MGLDAGGVREETRQGGEGVAAYVIPDPPWEWLDRLEAMLAALSCVPGLPTVDVLMTWPVTELRRWAGAFLRIPSLFGPSKAELAAKAKREAEKAKAAERSFWLTMFGAHATEAGKW